MDPIYVQGIVMNHRIQRGLCPKHGDELVFKDAEHVLKVGTYECPNLGCDYRSRYHDRETR